MCIRDRVSTQSTWDFQMFNKKDSELKTTKKFLSEGGEGTAIDKYAIWLAYEMGKLFLYKIATHASNLTKRGKIIESCLLYTSPSPRDLSTSRMPSSS
eukprot:TRINITY_DN20309_c0_g1_i1.p2 TRINITY_DN20309_c0_g1~~TRINITY_DN20309_c0_g1_i1.p2  ORF type:complete len:105 (-),score=60.49 TRINITY_DN20309_c0_g1_i1:10-303(-)